MMEAKSQIQQLPAGHHRARFVEDYTHQISLSGEKTLVFNLLTGLAWCGTRKSASAAKFHVERSRGHERAASILEELEKEYRSARLPLSFQLIPTYGCNFSCAYCYEGSLTTKQKIWSDEEIDQVVAVCERLARETGRSDLADVRLTVLGGEVIRTETFSSVERLVTQLHRRGGRFFEAITNGFELAQHAQKLQDIGISRVQVTVDGPRELHDKRRPIRRLKGSSFDQILDGVGRCLGLNIIVDLRINIDQNNIPSLKHLVALFDDRGWLKAGNFRGYLAPLERDFSGKMFFVAEDEMARMLAKETRIEPRLLKLRWDLHGLDYLYALRRGAKPRLKMRYCGATQSDYTLDARDQVYACWFGAGRADFKIGEISELGRGASLDEAGSAQLERWRNRGVTSMQACSTCKWALICGGGCAFKAAAKTGDINSPNCAPFAEIYDAVGKLIYES